MLILQGLLPCCLIMCMSLHVHMHDHNYYSRVCYDFDLDVHMLSLCCRGSSIWWDLTHWYFSVFHKPYNGIQDCVTKKFERWKATAESMGMNWGFERGPLPRCSSTSLWAISCDAVFARTLRPNQQQAIAYPWEVMWSICNYSGEIHIFGHRLEITEGCVNAASAVSALVKDDHVAGALLDGMSKLNVNVLRVPLPTLALSFERIATLRKGSLHLHTTARSLANTFLPMLDRFILETSSSILQKKLSIPDVIYIYIVMGGRHVLIPDCRSVSNQHMSLNTSSGSCVIASHGFLHSRTHISQDTSFRTDSRTQISGLRGQAKHRFQNTFQCFRPRTQISGGIVPADFGQEADFT